MPSTNPLAEYRRKTGQTPKEVGDLVGVNRATIYRWERGEPPIPVKYLEKVERLTGIPRQQLRPDIFGEAA